MEAPIRAATITVMEELGHVRQYSFYQLNSMLQRMCEQRNSDGETPTALRYRALPSLAFPAADVDHCQWRKTPDLDLVEMYVSFMGLYGPASPLPVYYTERVIQSKDPNHPSRDFMDLFNHQAISLLQRCWDKYRYYTQFEDAGHDQYSRWLLSTAGVDIERLEKTSHLKWHKLMPMIGLLANNVCTSDLLERVIKSYFGLTHVEIEPWIPRSIQVLEEQCNSIGKDNCGMGLDLVLGDEISDCSGKFAVHLYELPQKQFRQFMPGEKNFEQLVELVKLVQSAPLDYDICLYLDENDQIAQSQPPIEQQQMGWSSVLGNAQVQEPATICVSDYHKI